MIPIIFIIGPTATGKSEVGYLLARQLKGEVISCDSMLVYKEASIITSKPPREMLKEIPHHFVDIISVKDSYSVYDYYKAASAKIRGLFNRGISVIVCGGSGLYMKALLDGIFEGCAENKELRRQLAEKAKERGGRCLYEELERVDKETAKMLSPNDLKRVIRALEVYYSSAAPLSQKKKTSSGIYKELPIKIFGLRLNRDELYSRINQRADKMIEAGAVGEVEKLLKQNLGITAAKIIGVSELAAFLRKESSLVQAVDKMKRNTRRFAKRQVTWFKADKRIEWIDVDTLTIEQVKDSIVDKINI